MVERKNNKQKNRTKYFLPGGKKQIQAVFYLELSSHRTADPGSMCVFISGSPYSQLRSKPYA